MKHDSVSLIALRDTASFVTCTTDDMSKISRVFGFDRKVFKSQVYERIFRSSLKGALQGQRGQTPSLYLSSPLVTVEKKQTVEILPDYDASILLLGMNSES